MEMCVQGFDVNVEEAALLLGLGAQPVAAADGEASEGEGQLLGGVGGAVVSPEALRALAEGFESASGQVMIPAMGEGADADKLLRDEMLDAYDSPEARQIIKGVFVAVLAELCGQVDEVIAALRPYIDAVLKPNIDRTVMSMLKLNPAIEALIEAFEEKKGGESEANELLSLISGIIACSIPEALKESTSERDTVEEATFKATLLACIEDSIKSILEEDGTATENVRDDIKELFRLAKEINSDSNKSFFAKVAAVTEGRCNSKFMDTLLTKLSSEGRLHGMSTEDILAKIITIMGSRLPLQEGFKDMMENNPDFVQEVLKNLAKEGKKRGGSAGGNAVDLLHKAIVKAVDAGCAKQLDSLILQLEEAAAGGKQLDDEDVKTMLKQAAGLAKYMGRTEVTDNLQAILNDPAAIHAIRNDSLARDVLRKILVMRKMAANDETKRAKLLKLEQGGYGSDDDDSGSMRDFLNATDALTRGPGSAARLKKSKSMVQKSKSMIVTAKDIPMNAFMAMKGAASEKHDEKWLRNFLSESVVEEVPWECSKALIILKDGFQAIIPREAAKSILLGEASYTLIDDHGVEFYLSAEDKKRRERGEDNHDDSQHQSDPGSETAAKKTVTIGDVLKSDDHYQRATAKLAQKGIDEVSFYLKHSIEFLLNSVMHNLRAWTPNCACRHLNQSDDWVL